MELMNLLTELTDSVASYVSGNEMTISMQSLCWQS